MPRDEVLVGGIHAVRSLLTADRIDRLYLDLSLSSPRLAALKLEAIAKGIEVCARKRLELDRLVDEPNHQGVVASCLRLTPPTFSEVLTQKGTLMVLDGVTDPRNLGALMRVAYAFSVKAVIIPRRRSAPLSAVAFRAAAGAANLLPLIRVPNIARALEAIKSEAWTTIAATEEASESLFDCALSSPICWVLGDEGQGIRRLTSEHCDYLVRIPTLSGSSGCLNVSTAAAVCLAVEKMKVKS